MKKSAGIILYNLHGNTNELLLVLPDGPYWVGKNLNAWSIPKKEFENDEQTLKLRKENLKKKLE